MIRRFHHNAQKESCIIVAGEYFATREDMLIETVLGSCIAVCLFDFTRGVSGMNHFMLPSSRDQGANAVTHEGRYGVNAMELLINAMMQQGADRFALQAKVFGGGNVTELRNTTLKVGEWNTHFAMDFLANEGIPVVSKDVGGRNGRRIILFTQGGRVKLRRLGNDDSNKLAGNEMRYRSRIVKEQPTKQEEGELTLF